MPASPAASKTNETWTPYVESLLDGRFAGLAESTWNKYEMFDRLYCSPEFGHVRISDLTPRILDEFFRELANEKSAGTAQTVREFVSSVLSEAVRDGLIAYNIVRSTRPIKRPPPDTTAIPDEHIRAILEFAEGTIAFGPIKLCSILGLSVSECLYLEWRDVDLQSETITVYRKPKTRTRRRTLPLPSDAVEFLREWPQESRLVFPSQADTVIGRSNFERAWRNALRSASQKLNEPMHYRFHMLRHTVATRLLAEGHPLQLVSAWLGHASIGVTVNTYGHLQHDHLLPLAKRNRVPKSASGE